MLPRCTNETDTWKGDTPPFEQAVGDQVSATGTLTEVTANRLVLRTEQGTTLTYRWGGPSLEDAFTVGEAVTYERRDWWWNVVRSSTHSAAALAELGTISRPNSMQQIPDGPTYEVQLGCDSATGTRFRLHTEWDGEAIDIGVGETRALGEWQITNAEYWESECAPIPSCHTVFVFAVFALGPGR